MYAPVYASGAKLFNCTIPVAGSNVPILLCTINVDVPDLRTILISRTPIPFVGTTSSYTQVCPEYTNSDEDNTTDAFWNIASGKSIIYLDRLYGTRRRSI